MRDDLWRLSDVFKALERKKGTLDLLRKGRTQRRCVSFPALHTIAREQSQEVAHSNPRLVACQNASSRHLCQYSRLEIQYLGACIVVCAGTVTPPILIGWSEVCLNPPDGNCGHRLIASLIAAFRCGRVASCCMSFRSTSWSSSYIFL